MDKRKHMGKDKEGVIFPVAPNLSEMGDSYLQFIEEIKKEIQKRRVSVVLNANTSMICLYWNIGRAILKKQKEERWGAKVIDRMSKDLKIAFPEMSSFSPRNIKYMRRAAGSFRGWRTGFLFRSFVLSLEITLLCRDRIESL